MDTAAFYLAWFILIAMPIVGIVLFWLVHILPEKIAHKRHHPQKDAIQTLCLLSLVFGGLLWPIAWLWAYTKPVSYRLAYGTDKGDEYFVHMAEKAQAGELPPARLKYLLDELDAIASRGAMSLELQHARTKIEAAVAAKSAAAAPHRSGRRPRRPRREPRNGSPAARHLCLLRLADLHQVQVAAVDHHVQGHRRHHPDRGADGADPDAERRRALVGGRARLQVRGQRAAAGARPRARGAGRTQPPGEEG